MNGTQKSNTDLAEKYAWFGGSNSSDDDPPPDGAEQAPAKVREFAFANPDNVADNSPVRCWGTLVDVAKLARKTQSLDSKDGPAFVGAELDGEGRSDDNVVDVTWLTLDIEETPGTIPELQGALTDYARIVYTTRSHGVREAENPRTGKMQKKWKPGEPRFRVLAPYKRAVSVAEHAVIFDHFERVLDDAPDPATRNPSRVQFMPRKKHPDAERDPLFELHDDLPLLNPDALPDGEGGTVSVEELAKQQADKASADRTQRSEAPTRSNSSQSGDWPDDPEEWRDLLFEIPADVDSGMTEKKWRNVIWAFGHEYGDDDRAFELLDEWSQLAPDDYDPEALEDKWRRGLEREPDNPVKLGTVVHYARELGDYKGPAPGNTYWMKSKSHPEIGKKAIAELGGRCIWANGRGWRWDCERRYWKPLEERAIEKIVQSLDGAPYGSPDDPNFLHLRKSDISGATDCALREIPDRPGFFRDAPRGVAFANTFIGADTASGELDERDADPDNRNRFALPFEYDPDAQSNLWDQTVAGWFECDDDGEAKAQLLQEFAGAALLGIAPTYDKALWLEGEGANGKSTFIDVLEALFPSQAVESVPPSMLGDPSGNNAVYSMAKLDGARLNAVREVEAKHGVFTSNGLKALISGENPPQGRHPRGDFFTIDCQAAFVFASNGLPRVADDSRGFWRRWLVVPFNRDFSAAEVEIPDLEKRIIENHLPAVATWAVKGARRLLANGEYTIPDSCRTAWRQWRRESNPIRLFVNEEIKAVFDFDQPGRSVRGDGTENSAVYNRYKQWAKENGFGDCSKTKFSRRLLKITVQGVNLEQRNSGGRFWNFSFDPADRASEVPSAGVIE